DARPARHLAAGIMKIALPELDMRRLLQVAISVAAQIYDDDLPVSEVGFHVARVPGSHEILVAAPLPVVTEARGVLEHVRDEDERLAAAVLDLLRAGDQLQRFENRRTLAHLGGQAL